MTACVRGHPAEASGTPTIHETPNRSLTMPKLGEKKVDILPPDPIGELGSGWEKVQKDKGLTLPVVK